MKYLIVFTGGTVFMVVCILIGMYGCGSEMQAVPGYEHGVVLCDAESIIINLGHEDDPEVSELLALAKQCSNYQE